MCIGQFIFSLYSYGALSLGFINSNVESHTVEHMLPG